MYADYLLAFELHKGSLSASSGLYFENPIYESDEKEIQAFDSHFPPKELQSGTPGQKKLALMITRVRPKG